MTEIRIEKWSLAELPDDPYCPPENKVKVLQGHVYGYPGRPDGERINTSPIEKVAGRRVMTRSGKFYLLGEIDPNYKEWLEHEGFVYNPEEPISIGKPAPRKTP